MDVLGPGHPFAEEIARDLVDLLHHPDSGDFVLSGWIPGKTPVSFPDENGAHAGPGSEETHAFLLVPDGTDIETKTYYRALDMRKAALRVLNRTSNTGDLSGGSLQDCTPEHSGNTGTDSHTKCALQKSQ